MIKWIIEMVVLNDLHGTGLWNMGRILTSFYASLRSKLSKIFALSLLKNISASGKIYQQKWHWKLLHKTYAKNLSPLTKPLGPVKIDPPLINLWKPGQLPMPCPTTHPKRNFEKQLQCILGGQIFYKSNHSKCVFIFVVPLWHLLPTSPASQFHTPVVTVVSLKLVFYALERGLFSNTFFMLFKSKWYEPREKRGNVEFDLLLFGLCKLSLTYEAGRQQGKQSHWF